MPGSVPNLSLRMKAISKSDIVDAPFLPSPSREYNKPLLCTFLACVALTKQSSLAQVSLIALSLLIACGDIETNPGPLNNNLTSLCVIQCNINSLFAYNSDNKLAELDILAQNTNADVIALTETWLDDTVADQLISLNGFLPPFRTDRNRHGGGVAIYCAEHLPVVVRPDLTPPGIESLWVEVQVKHNEHVLIGVCYRPPNQNADSRDHFLSNMEQTINRIMEENSKSIMLTGDFNDRCTQWHSEHRNSELGCKLYDIVGNNGLTQVIDSPTHLDNTGRPQHLLDLVITDTPALVIDTGVLAPIGRCHHCPTMCKLAIYLHKEKSYKRFIWDFKNADVTNLNDALSSAPWSVAFETFNDIDDIVHYWTSLFLEIATEYIPTREITVRPRDKPWVTKRLKTLIRNKNRLWKRYKRTSNPAHLNTYRTVKNRTVRELNCAKTAYFNAAIPVLENPDANAKKWWNLTKSMINNKCLSSIPPS